MKYLVRFFVALAALFVGAGSALADSEYGYNSAGTGALTARSNLTVRVEVPKLALLRVGPAASVQVATITGVVTIPGGGAPVNGSNQATTWDGTAPTLTTASSAAVRAFAWTNASAGGSLAVTSSSGFTTLTPAQVTVTSTTVPTFGALDHPNANLTTGGTPTTFVRNSLRASDWVFEVSGAVLSTLPAGVETQNVVYTLSVL